MSKKRKKKQKKRHLFGKKEFLFNFFSLLAMIVVALYFGGRSFYYYSKQTMNKKIEAQTLNGLVIQNNPVSKTDGLHQDKDGYFFKGNVSNNYVSFENQLFRIIRIHSDNTVKVVSENIVASFPWGEKSNYQDSNVQNWLNQTDKENSGIYYQTIPSIDKFLVKTSYSEDVLKNNEVATAKKKYQDYITTLNIDDYIMANGKSSFLNNGKMYYLLGLNESSENLYVEEDGSIQSCDSLDGYGVRVVFTFVNNLSVTSGDGTKENPYVIDQGENKNKIGSYVKLGEDVWRVISEKDGVIRLQLNHSALYNGEELFYHYSDYNSKFDLTDKKSLAYFLNTTYLTTLPYAGILLDANFYVGEISDDAGYSYFNIYQDKVSSKIGLLNIYDFHVNSELEDYYHMNTTSEIGSMGYVFSKNGFLKEVDVRESKHVVPVISIQSNVLKSGDGTEKNPYIMG